MSRPFISIKWKAIVFTSLALCALAGMFAAQGYRTLHSQFDDHRRDVLLSNEAEAAVLVEHSLRSLRQAAEVIGVVSGLPAAVASGQLDSILEQLSTQWPLLQLELDITLMRVFGAGGEQLLSWGDDAAETAVLPVPQWLQTARESDAPLVAVHCGLSCGQYAAVPLLAEGRHAGFLLLATSFAELTLRLQQVSGNEVGVFAPREATASWGAIRPWGGQLVALTNADFSLPAVLAAAEIRPLADLLGASQRVMVDGKHFELAALPLGEPSTNEAPTLLLIEDITREVEAIARRTREMFIIALIGVFGTQLLLLAVLWGPMERLRRATLALPLLATRGFDELRTTLRAPRRARLASDEVDVLEKAAIGLSGQLEQLDNQVAAQQLEIGERMDELAAERDFIGSVLHIANAIILTLDRDNRILMLNHYGQWLCGYAEHEVIGLTMNQAFGADCVPLEPLTQSLGKFNYEDVLITREGARHSIAWYHARLPDIPGREAVVVTVGLDVTERKLAEEQLAWLAEHDPLTGLFNRRFFERELERSIAAAQRYGRTGAILYIDLDQFKDVNDISGHHAGDAMLKQVADALTANLRGLDFVARLGGDEFAVILAEATTQNATDTARKVNSILSTIVLTADKRQYRPTASIGIALFPRDGGTPSDLLANADLAMYHAKEAGHGQFHLLEPSDDARQRLEIRFHWRQRVVQALEQDRFVLYVQPIQDIVTRSIGHYELLLRMLDDDQNVISPHNFIPAAERSGLIHDIDRMVLQKAAMLLGRFKRARKDVTLAVNLSAHSFKAGDLADYVRGVLREAQADPSKLIIEITETAAVADFTVTRDHILAIKSFGCRFALDDFGVGFSSFYYLKHLPVDYVKIDGSFIQNLSTSQDDQTIVRAMAAVARGFGKLTVAEFVEDARTLELLRTYGIKYAQGFHIGKPAPLEHHFSEVLSAPQKKKGRILTLPKD